MQIWWRQGILKEQRKKSLLPLYVRHSKTLLVKLPNTVLEYATSSETSYTSMILSQLLLFILVDTLTG